MVCKSKSPWNDDNSLFLSLIPNIHCNTQHMSHKHDLQRETHNNNKNPVENNDQDLLFAKGKEKINLAY